jgi:transposase
MGKRTMRTRAVGLQRNLRSFSSLVEMCHDPLQAGGHPAQVHRDRPRRQLLPGTFEPALHRLLKQAIDLTPFDARYRNDETGAPAYAPAMLLRVVLFAYSRRIISSRAIARACKDQVTFIALSGDSRPHFTTFANFVSTLGDQIAPIFAAVLAVCDRQKLIGREMFAIDGVKLPSNASKHRSGTRADFERQATKMERAAEAMLARHREADARDVEPSLAAKDTARRTRSWSTHRCMPWGPNRNCP